MSRPSLAAPACALALAVSTLACGSGSSPGGAGGDGNPDGGGAAPAEPITGLATGEWSWVPFPDSSCSDGSPTGIGVNPGTGPDLVFFLDGGGACSSNLTCFFLRTAALGPFGQAEFDSRMADTPGSILDRTLTDNPFADATLVFVPYCTGDVHSGDRVVAYTDDPGGTVHHKGHANVLAFLKRLEVTYPSPRRLVVTGSSAGGFGALVNYQTIRSSFSAAQGFLVDDSGPPLQSDGGALVQGGFDNWGIADVLDPLCGPGVCEENLSLGLAALLRTYPTDRFALLSHDADSVISSFYFIEEAEFTSQLLQMTSDVIDPAANARAFIKAGQAHTMLGHPGTVSQGDVPLVTWLADEVTGSAGWSTVRP